MDPRYEQKLRDEVIYLHSLWHQGPPRAIATPSNHLQPVRTTEFKKLNKRRGKKGKKVGSKPGNPSPDSSAGSEWQCPSPPPPSTSWASLNVKPDPKPHSLSPKEQSRVAAINVQQHAVKVFHEFLKSNDTDDSDGIDSSSDENDELMEEDDGREAYSFFCKVFMDDAELREHYKKNFVQGDFICLVCSVVGGKKTGRRYRGCLALIQHSISIAKTKRRRAHRAFGQAVCKVLGWNIDQLPAIVSSLSDKAGDRQESVKSENTEDSITIFSNMCPLQDNTLKIGPEGESVCDGDLTNAGVEATNSLTCCSGDKNLEDLPGSLNAEKLATEHAMINSLTCPGGDKNLENLSTQGPLHGEEPATEHVMIDSSTYPDGDKNIEDLVQPCAHEVDEPVTDSLTSNAWTCPDVDLSEGLGMPKPVNVLEPAAGVLMIEPVGETSGLGNEILEQQEDDAILNLLNKDNADEK